MNFADAAMNTVREARTENGMKTQESSLRHTVDLFFKVGASRGQDLTKDFERAYQEDREITLRLAQWVRDARGGAGEREMFRSFLRYIEKYHFDDLDLFLAKVPELGRWDDLLVMQTPEGKAKAFNLIGDGLLIEKNGLCAKWMPRKGQTAVELRAFLGMSPKQYRKTLVTMTKVVETAMCAKNWDSINFEHVPSVAMSRYMRAFGKNAPLAFSNYKAKLVKGEAKVNAGALFPYDVIHSIHTNELDPRVADAQWAALPNYVGNAAILPIVDVSGSMMTPVMKNGTTALEVAVSLGLYLADKNTGVFKDLFLTFSERSKFIRLKGKLSEKMRQMETSEWGMSTNLHAAFEEILRVAVSGKVLEADMPAYVLILSDMQFNACVRYDDTAMQMIARKYEAAGYSLPNVIFWNINSKAGTPVSFDKKGAALVSGFSPAITKAILKAETVTPEAVMLEALLNDRYDLIGQ